MIFLQSEKTHATQVFEESLPSKYSGRWPPNLSSLAGVGFDSISQAKNSVLLKKAHGHDFSGKPHSFTEIEIGKAAISLRYACGKSQHPEIRRLHSSLLLLRALRLVPGITTDAQALAAFLLPSLEAASKATDSHYETLAKKHSDLAAESRSLSEKSARNAKAAESHARVVLELERRVSALQERIRRLEAVSDAALREMCLEWLQSHRGAFNTAAFSKASGVPPARAEEGMEMLLKDGVIRRVANGFSVAKQEAPQQFERQKTGIFSGFGKMLSSAKLKFSLKKKE